MNQQEFEIFLAETEKRLDRLKALYEQYFQGIEKLEPSIPRKEIDRRIQTLRKHPPRQTALRFRFQSLIQRYTTYQTYWTRIARRIEEGTYHRDVRRAKQRRARIEKQQQQQRAAEPDIDIDVDLGAFDADAELAAALADVEATAMRDVPRAAPHDTEKPPPTKRRSISPFAVPGSSRPPPPPARPSAPVMATFGKPTDSGTRPSGKPSFRPPAQTAAGASRSFAPPSESTAPSRSFAPPQDAARKSFAPPGRPGGATPPPPVPPPRTASRAPGPPVPAAARPLPPRASVPGAPGRVSRPGTGPADDQMRRIYDQYIDARRRNNERTDNVRYETLAKSIEKMVPKLQQKHRGKKIDFEVVVKDGKVGLKPVPK